mmetsp:Transcript_100619/g.259829  ORF Transcript_100619/g.259829 Transcript_100619/m.259829 type:complete len:120 (-) Transcript_100619:57-416(-)
MASRTAALLLALAVGVAAGESAAAESKSFMEGQGVDAPGYAAFLATAKASAASAQDRARQERVEASLEADRSLDVPISDDFAALAEGDGEAATPTLREMARSSWAALRPAAVQPHRAEK